jgi:predicted dehydrogenase
MTIAAALLIIISACTGNRKEIRIVTLDPGHFHAALVQKTSHRGVSKDVYVYAPDDSQELRQHISTINSYNTRADNPAGWNLTIYTGSDFLDRFIAEKKGNLMITAGNNLKKTGYIQLALSAGINVLADKPAAINGENFKALEECFNIARQNDVLLYDIMTERFEITTILQREISLITDIYGHQTTGSAIQPGIEKGSVHLFKKEVSGKPVIRPAWFFDVEQQGEAIADVAVHLVDLVQWAMFNKQSIDYLEDIDMIDASHYPTHISAAQFEEVTGVASFPVFLKKYVDSDTLKVYANGEINYRIKGIHARVTVNWDFTNPAGRDTHRSIMRGSRANLVIKQGEEENYTPTLYIEPSPGTSFSGKDIRTAFDVIERKYPGMTLEPYGSRQWKVVVPESYRTGHEDHFGKVMEFFISCLHNGKIPKWETDFMLAKYFVTTQALESAKNSQP